FCHSAKSEGRLSRLSPCANHPSKLERKLGLRGPGSSKFVAARKAGAKRRARETWDDPKLSRLDRVIAFITAMPITKGIKAGEPYALLADQYAFLAAIYDRPDDNPVRLAVKSLPRGNGKTGLIAPLALCHLLGPEAEPRGEVYSAAIDRQQAGIIFTEREAILIACPHLAARVNTVRWHKR